MEYLFSIAQFGVALNVDQNKVRHLIDSNDIPIKRQIGATRTYGRDVLNWLKWEIEAMPKIREMKIAKLKERAVTA